MYQGANDGGKGKVNKKSKFRFGDPVLVLDEGLAMLRQIIGDGKPNHHGWVHKISEDEKVVYVEFPIGDDNPDEHSQLAPYPVELVKPRKGIRR